MSGIWVELNELQTEKETRDKVTELNKGESDTEYGFIANTKASKMTEDDQKTLKIYQKDINTNIALNNTNHTILKIIDVNKQEPIQNATAVYNPVTGRITVNVTGAINGISKIVDENGEELDYPDANDKTTAITKEETLIGNGVYYFYIMDTQGNIARVRCQVTGSNVYVIKDRETLYLFRDAVNGGQTNAIGYQVADVQLNKGKYTINEETGLPEFDSDAEQWVPVGNYSYNGKSFTGKYYGNNYTISGIISTQESYNQGFIGGCSGEIMDLNITESYIYGYDKIGGFVGIVKGNTTIKNCSYSGKIRNDGGNEGTGGIVGRVDSNLTINNCNFNGLVTGYFCGGLVGYTSNGSLDIKECKVEGTIANRGYSGGLVGDFYGKSLSIIDSENWAQIQINSNDIGRAGGIVGYTSCESLNIVNCSNHAKIEKNSGWSGYDAYAGGIIGDIDSCTNGLIINNCYNEGEIYVKGGSAGGLIGRLTGGKTNQISNCYNNGIVTGLGYIGGLIGHIYSWTTKPVYLTNCYNIKEIKGTEMVGGLIGYGYIPNIKHCYNLGEISGSSNYVGGIAGFATNETSSYVYEPEIAYTYNTGNVTGKENVGGIIGYFSGDSSHKQLRIYNTYNTGGVTGKSYVGGIVGYLYIYNGYDTTYVKYSYNTGKVSGKGVAGRVDYGNIEDSGYLAGSGSGGNNTTEYATIEEMPTLESVITE